MPQEKEVISEGSQRISIPAATRSYPLLYVKNLLATASEVLAAEELLITRLKGDENIPPFEKPKPPKSSDYLHFNEHLDKRPVGISTSDLTDADKAFQIVHYAGTRTRPGKDESTRGGRASKKHARSPKFAEFSRVG
jgi:hypothetical protein